MNKNYYEFVFISDQGKNINLKIPNAVKSSDTDQFAEDMDLIIASNVILTSAGKPVAKRFVRYIEPKIIDVTVQNN